MGESPIVKSTVWRVPGKAMSQAREPGVSWSLETNFIRRADRPNGEMHCRRSQDRYPLDLYLERL